MESTFFYLFFYPTFIALLDCFGEVVFIFSFQVVFAKLLDMRCADMIIPASQTVSASDYNHSQEFLMVM
jgi:hypothetical protein